MLAMDRSDLADDPNLADNAGRDARADELYAAIGGWVADRDEIDVLAAMATAEVPASRVFSVADMFADPQFRAPEMIAMANRPDGRPLAVPGIVPKLSATPGGTDHLGPELGADTDAVLVALGYGSARIAQLRSDGVI